MFATVHPEVLAPEWLPPTAIGREAEVAEVVRRLDPPAPRAPPPWTVAVVGPPGAGTSTVARRAAREAADRIRAARPGPPPRFLGVRTRGLRGTHGVATALLRRLDDGFDGRGFAVTEVLAGLLRRIRREGRPVLLLLDDVGTGGPDLAPILRAFGDPDRFLPEGEVGLPPVWGILAGTEEAVSVAATAVAPRVDLGRFVAVRPLSPPLLGQIVRDRLARALGGSPPPELAEQLVVRALEEGGGTTRAVELVRRALLGGGSSRAGIAPFLAGRGPVAVEPRVVRAIGAAVRGASAGVGDVRRQEAEFARSEGLRPLPITTLWRRIVRLEQAGYIRREIRTGGTGGTRSVVRVLTPIDEWVTSPFRPETPRAYATLDATEPPAPAGGRAPGAPGGPGA